MKPKKSLSVLKTALWLCLASLLGLALIFPEVMVHRSISFFIWNDYLVDYQAAYVLTGFFYQGGIQLWDFFGQVSHAFFWVTHGMFCLPNLLTAAVFVVFSPFVDNSAQFFDRVFSLMYVGSLLCIRTIGIFLLLQRFTGNKWVLRLGTVAFALLFCPPAFMFGTFYQSFYPLLMYFILSFFLTGRLRYFVMSALFIVVSFSQGIVHTCYMYLGINFFIVSCAVYSLLTNYTKIRRWKDSFRKHSKILGISALGILAVAILTLGPYVYMDLRCLNNEAMSMDHSRLNGMWSVAHYFHGLMLDQSPPSDFFRRMLDFTFQPGRSFFLGYMMFFLSGLALTMSQDRRKWIFVLAVLLVWFLNFPRDTFNIGLIGHWVNVLTNPLKVMVRSYQTAINSIIGYLLMPLALLGLGVVNDLGKGVVFKPWRFVAFAVFLIIYAVNGCSYQYPIVKIYLVSAMIISVTAMLLLLYGARHTVVRQSAFAAIVLLIMTDMFLSAWDMKHFIAENCSLRPHFLEVMPAKEGTVGLDFHNPKIFPFVEQSEIYPDTGNTYLSVMKEISSNYHSVINRQMAFTPAPLDPHCPLHISFQGWANDPLMREYISQNNFLFFFAPYAVRQKSGVFESIVRRKLARDVLMVQGNDPSLVNEVPSRLMPLPRGEDQWYIIPENINDGTPGWVYEKGMAIWDFPLPGAIPDYFATNILTHDPWVRFFIQSADQKYTELAPVQGQLLRPMTFDVQNIKEGKVFVALPANVSFVGQKGVLLLKMKDASGISSVWLHHSDETGITFQAPLNGWLGIEYPYDTKWRIVLDGKQVHYYRVDKSFIGFPVTQGEHKILVRYWPGSWLRWGLPLSVIITTLLFIILIIYALREAKYE